jgi:hypothetical protein
MLAGACCAEAIATTRLRRALLSGHLELHGARRRISIAPGSW